MKTFVTVILIGMLTAAVAFADETYVFQNPQTQESAEPPTNQLVGASSPFSLLDFSRLHMQHSYNLSFFSSGGHSESIAMYLNQIDYDLTSTMRLSVGLAWLHQPQATLGFSEQTVSERLLPSFSLSWQPSKNFFLRVDYRTLSPYSSYYHYRDRDQDRYYDRGQGSLWEFRNE
jgi:hypothetical protein